MAAVAAEPPHHHLEVELVPGENRLTARDRIRWEGSGRLTFRLHPALAPREIRVDGAPYAVTAGERPGRWRGRRALEAGRHRVVIAYGGQLPPGSEQPGFRDVLKGFPPRITPGGTYLPAGAAWVPDLGSTRLTYRLRVTAPPGQAVAAAGARTGSGEGAEATTFAYDRPIPGITLLAGPYRRMTGPGEGPIPVAAFLHPDVTPVGEAHLAAAEGFLARYQGRYGPYPHPRFDLVSSPWPTGFGFPGLAYIGRRILPLPFITRTSLPHEILHNWWGNGVYVAPDSGNWAEGLTTFGAEYRLAEERSGVEARAMRRRWLADFASYHRDRRSPRLRDFQARVDGGSRAVGYNKAAFLWLMLRERLGQATFRAGLRRFYADHRHRHADWRDLRTAFEAVSGQDLGGYFGQWLDRPGAPEPRLAGVAAGKAGLRLTLTQPEPAYHLTLPVALTFADGATAKHEVALDAARETVSIATGGREVVRVRVDPAFRTFRRLSAAAIPPRLSAIMAEGERPVIALAPALDSDKTRRAAERLGQALWDRSPRVVGGGTETPAPVRIVPRDALKAHWRGLGGEESLPSWPEAADARVAVGRAGPGQPPVLLIGVTGPAALGALARPLPHYGSYGWLAFHGGERLARGRWPVREPALTWRSPKISRQNGG